MGKFLQASVGFGGSCFQKDILNLVYLCESYGLRECAEYWNWVVQMNEYQKSRFSLNMVRSMFNTVTGKKIAIFGFAFKKDTGDTRETAAAFIARDLVEEQARGHVYDPQVSRESMFAEFKYTLNLSEETKPGLGELVVTSPDATARPRARTPSPSPPSGTSSRLWTTRRFMTAWPSRPSSSTAATSSTRPPCARSASRSTPSASPWAEVGHPVPPPLEGKAVLKK